MATSVLLAENLALLFGARVSTCTNSYKQLQSADMVSKGGRGRHASQVTSKDCTMLVLSLIGSEHISDAPEAARRYSSLRARHRNSTGSYVDDREESESAWYAMAKKFPRLRTLDAGHALWEVISALIESYTDDFAPGNKVYPPSIAVTIRGPQISALVVLRDNGGEEQIEYVTASGKDMFRMVVGNPLNKGLSNPLGIRSDLHVEKRITHETLKALGVMLRDDK
jgi:hypothetical protein